MRFRVRARQSPTGPTAASAPDSQSALGHNELVDRAWEIHDADLASARFSGMTRRLPSLIAQV
ncbi:MAG TPA: hypothetical protein VFN75_02980, partial [Pseudonocardiaceae bacterium]|nr:hypothetical protein [Pseudonocardiaceae bacterium]